MNKDCKFCKGTRFRRINGHDVYCEPCGRLAIRRYKGIPDKKKNKSSGTQRFYKNAEFIMVGTNKVKRES